MAVTIGLMRVEKGNAMTNALILGMMWMLFESTDVSYPKVFVLMWWLAILFNSFAGEKWR